MVLDGRAMATASVCTDRATVQALPLDRYVPKSVMRRRGAISFASSNHYITVPRFERRGAISFDKKDNNALYVRMLGDMRMQSRTPVCGERRRSLCNDPDAKLLENLSVKDFRTKCGLRFLSEHKVRHRRRAMNRPCVRDITHLDQDYCGQAQCFLNFVDRWSFDIFNLDSLTNGRSLFNVAMKIFQEYNFIHTFHLDIVKLMRFLTLVEDGYHSNPYHNALHGADVTQAMHCFLQEKKLKSCVSDFEAMIALISAMTHDLDHPGVNQAYLIATSNHLAALYENSSVLENHHWRTAMAAIIESELFSHFDSSRWSNVEYQLKSLILATDITRQQEFLTKFRRLLDSSDFDVMNDAAHRHFTLQICLKCADIGNPCRHWKQSKLWAEKICEEFFRQGDSERKRSMSITPLCDRFSTTVAKIQTGFIDFVVTPLFQEWSRFVDSKLAREMQANISVNKASWQQILHDMACEDEKLNTLLAPATSPTASTESDSDASIMSMRDCEDEEADVVAETRFTILYHSRDDSSNSAGAPDDDSHRSLSPVSEHYEHMARASNRRHSMPACYIKKEITRLTMRRDSFPKIKLARRRSMPHTKVYHTTSFDRLNDKLSALSAEHLINWSASTEYLANRPNIATLSQMDSGGLWCSDPLLTSQRFQTAPPRRSSKPPKVTALISATCMSPPPDRGSRCSPNSSRLVLGPIPNHSNIEDSNRRRTSMPEVTKLLAGTENIFMNTEAKGLSIRRHSAGQISH